MGEREMVGAAGQKRVPHSFLENLHFPIPSINVQKVIMSYLDNKLLKIDDLISKKQKLIDLLKEERAVIINQAVTKGINPKVEMKQDDMAKLAIVPMLLLAAMTIILGLYIPNGLQTLAQDAIKELK